MKTNPLAGLSPSPLGSQCRQQIELTILEMCKPADRQMRLWCVEALTKTRSAFVVEATGLQVAAMITSNWECAVAQYRDLIPANVNVPLLYDAGLLATRVDWLAYHPCYAARVWLTAHSRMQIWLEAHPATPTPPPAVVLPRPALCMHQGHMTDMRQELIALDFDHPASTTKQKIVHLMNKGLPKRCQIRELSRFISRYMNEDVICHVNFTRMLFCSLAGLYRHCDSIVPFDMQSALLAGLLYQPRSCNIVSNWVKNKDRSSDRLLNQHLCLFVLRENLCANIEDLPTLRVTLLRRRKWDTFEQHTYSVMNKLRKRLYELHDGDSQLSTKQVCEVAGDTLIQILEPSTVRVKNQFDRVYDLTLQSVCKAFCGLRHQHSATVHDVLGLNMMELLMQIKHATKEIPVDLKDFEERLEMLFRDRESIHFVRKILRLVHGSGTPASLPTYLVEFLKHNVYDYSVTEQELHNVIEIQDTVLHRLPEAHMVAHTLAIDAAWSVAGGIRALPHCGNLLVCAACGEVKNALASSNTRRTQGKKDTPPSVSCVRVAIDDDAKTLRCSQTHDQCKMYKAATAYLNNSGQWPVDDAQRYKTTSTSFDTVVTSLRCEANPLSVIPLCGGLLSHKGNLYSVCHTCGRLMQLGPGLVPCCVWCRREASARQAKQAALCSMCDDGHKKATSTITCYNLLDPGVLFGCALCPSCVQLAVHTPGYKSSQCINFEVLHASFQHQQVMRQLKSPGQRIPPRHRHTSKK